MCGLPPESLIARHFGSRAEPKGAPVGKYDFHFFSSSAASSFLASIGARDVKFALISDRVSAVAYSAHVPFGVERRLQGRKSGICCQLLRRSG